MNIAPAPRSFLRGPWSDEPNFEEWVDPDTGYDCRVVRHYYGHLCGYVRIPGDHPLFRTDDAEPVPGRLRDRIDQMMKEPIGGRPPAQVLMSVIEGHIRSGLLVDVHGGITYSGPGVLADDEIVSGWWWGFDCNHMDDESPSPEVPKLPEAEYRTFEYAKSECKSLARQLFELD